MASTNVLNEPYDETKILAHVTVTNMFLSFSTHTRFWSEGNKRGTENEREQH